MFKTLLNVFRVPELRNKVLFTLLMLAIYRVGFHIPLPGVDQDALKKMADEQNKSKETSAASRIANYVSLFSGGSLSQSTIFGLGIMPYISASIIFQLLGTVIPSLEKLQKEGETGRRKIQEWTRYTTVPLCIVQAIFWIAFMHSGGGGNAGSLVQPKFQTVYSWYFWVMGILSLTTGTVFLMWLGEQIDEYGLGNGVSFIILAGIVARMPQAIILLIQTTNFKAGQADATHPITPGKIIFLAACFVFVIAGSVLITQAQRRIPIQQAKHTRGRRIYGGQKQYLPLRVNHGGVMPIIFAQSLMLFPGVALGWLWTQIQTSANTHRTTVGITGEIIQWLNNQFSLGRGGFIYLLAES